MPSNEEKSTQLDMSDEFFTLHPQMQRFVQMYLTGQYTFGKIAELLDVHPNTITAWMKREDVQNAIHESQSMIHSQVGANLKSLTLKATRRLHELIDSPIDAVSLQAVKDVLDRSGHKAKQEIKVDKTVTNIEQQMRELIDSTIMLEADFEEVVDDDTEH